MELLDVADAETVFAATDAVIARDPGAALRRVQELSDAGRDPVQFMRDLTAHLRHLIVVQTLGEPPDSFSVTADQVPRLEGQARDLAQAEAVRAIDLLADAVAAVKDGADPRTQLELALLKAARPRADASIEALLMRLERLEQGEPDGGAPAPPPPSKARTPPGPPRRAGRRERRRPAPPGPPLAGRRGAGAAVAGGAGAGARGRGRRDDGRAAGGGTPDVARGRRAGPRLSGVRIVQQAQDRGPRERRAPVAGAAAGVRPSAGRAVRDPRRPRATRSPASRRAASPRTS